ncbi:aryl-sulfate sulfotransferase [Pedobacter sp.]|uniref:aryl-sulfate sulfotransferase n=1 Tax=Pedobacter sp. TaxID=1411316 RepID=UPI002CF0FAA8|nr:aryl-sulfate sulfotransferase [Pedobacter sp.]HWW38980.1 aryl-sulfate sulfotransferase [Pedobacter sp.]
MEIILKRGRTALVMLVLPLMLLMACKKDKVAESSKEGVYEASLESMTEKGNLLLNYVKGDKVYTFNFETGVVEIPVLSILTIEDHPDQWATVVNFADKKSLSVPSKGNALDFMVKKVTLNPSGYNPLAATVEVFMPARGRIKVVIQSKTGKNGTIEHLFTASNNRQIIPVLGLYANYNNQVDLVFTDMNGKERGRTQVNIQTAPLNVGAFPSFEIITAQKGRMEPGLNLVSYPGESELDTSCPYMLDADGEVRWILLLKPSPDLKRFGEAIGFKRMKNGNFLSGDKDASRIVEVDMLGNLVHQWDLIKLGYTFHHEVTEASNGNFLITVSKSDARLVNGKPRINDHIIEVNPVSGTLVKEWDLANMLDTSRYESHKDVLPGDIIQTPSNWAHNNSIAERGADLMATVRFQGLMSFNKDGNVKWIISPHKNWGTAYQKYLLSPVDESGRVVTDPKVISGEAGASGFDWAWGPHTPVLMPNGHILVFDNGYYRHFQPNTMVDADSYSRIVEYKVDEAQRTVQQVWSYGKERGVKSFAPALSSIQFLPQTGHVLYCPGIGNKTNKGVGGRIVEIDPATKEVIYELEITAPSTTAFHRVTRMEIYPGNL